MTMVYEYKYCDFGRYSSSCIYLKQRFGFNCLLQVEPAQ
jgi:hypothetical protein